MRTSGILHLINQYIYIYIYIYIVPHMHRIHIVWHPKKKNRLGNLETCCCFCCCFSNDDQSYLPPCLPAKSHILTLANHSIPPPYPVFLYKFACRDNRSAASYGNSLRRSSYPSSSSPSSPLRAKHSSLRGGSSSNNSKRNVNLDAVRVYVQAEASRRGIHSELIDEFLHPDRLASMISEMATKEPRQDSYGSDGGHGGRGGGGTLSTSSAAAVGRRRDRRRPSDHRRGPQAPESSASVGAAQRMSLPAFGQRSHRRDREQRGRPDVGSPILATRAMQLDASDDFAARSSQELGRRYGEELKTRSPAILRARLRHADVAGISGGSGHLSSDAVDRPGRPAFASALRRNGTLPPAVAFANKPEFMRRIEELARLEGESSRSESWGLIKRGAKRQAAAEAASAASGSAAAAAAAGGASHHVGGAGGAGISGSTSVRSNRHVYTAGTARGNPATTRGRGGYLVPGSHR